MGDGVYDNEFAVLEGEFVKLSAGLFGQYRWQPRWVVLTPTNLHIYKAAARPRPGTKPYKALYLDHAQVEEVRPGNVEAFRPHAFSIVVPGSEHETVLAAPSGDAAAEWIDALDKQAILTNYAAENGLSLDAQGHLYDDDMNIVTTAEDVLMLRDPPRASTIDALAGDDVLSALKNDVALAEPAHFPVADGGGAGGGGSGSDDDPVGGGGGGGGGGPPLPAGGDTRPLKA